MVLALRSSAFLKVLTLMIVTTPAVPATEDSPAVPEQTTVETMKYTQLLMHVRQLKKCGKASKGYNKAERMAKNANPLALVATAQTFQDPYYQTSKPHKSYAPTSKASLPTRSSHANYKLQSKEMPNQAHHHLSQLLKKNDCRKPKWVKDSTYHKEKMLLCKQAKKGVQLQAEQSDWLADTNEEIDEQDNTCTVETGDSNVTPDSPDMCDNDIQDDQNDVECDDERVALANLIANLKLDVDEKKKI
ncbi:hypothetical protein Tco_1055680 [Tanacetum coccineum]|uniref:Secreted protein n=1 Tax=Tanacetum coccineum TaxID=301880 RepID=A0ABQ5H2P7_9ASTR